MRKNKSLVLVLALVLLLGVSVGGTLAWLTAQTDEVKNTFTSAKLFDDAATEFTLWEHEATDSDGDGVYTLDTNSEVPSNTYKVLPGVNIPKDPTVDIVDLQENAYLYIKVTSNLPNTLSYSIDDDNWESLTGTTGVWVYKGEHAVDNVIKPTDTEHHTFTVNILTQETDGTAITVASDYSGTNSVELTFNAYMVQAAGTGTAAEAWDKANFA